MPKYRIRCSFGFVGTDREDVIEAETLEEAEEAAWEFATSYIDAYAEEIKDDDEGSDED